MSTNVNMVAGVISDITVSNYPNLPLGCELYQLYPVMSINNPNRLPSILTPKKETMLGSSSQNVDHQEENLHDPQLV